MPACQPVLPRAFSICPHGSLELPLRRRCTHSHKRLEFEMLLGHHLSFGLARPGQWLLLIETLRVHQEQVKMEVLLARSLSALTRAMDHQFVGAVLLDLRVRVGGFPKPSRETATGPPLLSGIQTPFQMAHSLDLSKVGLSNTSSHSAVEEAVIQQALITAEQACIATEQKLAKLTVQNCSCTAQKAP